MKMGVNYFPLQPGKWYSGPQRKRELFPPHWNSALCNQQCLPDGSNKSQGMAIKAVDLEDKNSGGLRT